MSTFKYLTYGVDQVIVGAAVSQLSKEDWTAIAHGTKQAIGREYYSEALATLTGGAFGLALFRAAKPATNAGAKEFIRLGERPSVRQGGRDLIVHPDQAIIKKYQQYYDDAWQKVVKDFNAGKIKINPKLHWKTNLGREVDRQARRSLKKHLKGQGISEGRAEDVLVNRRLYDLHGSGKYRIPDLKLDKTGKIVDGTIGKKTKNTPQIKDFHDFSGGKEVIIIKPQKGPGSGNN